jgi:MFS family permease
MIFNPPTRRAPAAAVAQGELDGRFDGTVEGAVDGAVTGAVGADRGRDQDRGPDRERPPLFDPAMLGVLAATVGVLAVLGGTDVSIVAHVRAAGQVGQGWLVFLVWSLASMIGGLIFGGIHRPVPVYWLLLALGLLTIPVGAAPGTWGLALALIPAGFLCAPALSASTAAISVLVPEQRRGEAMGWLGSAMTLGLTIGTPAAGSAIDLFGAWAGFALLGTLGVAVALVGLLLVGWRTDRPGSDDSADELGAPSGVSPTRRLTASTGS